MNRHVLLSLSLLLAAGVAAAATPIDETRSIDADAVIEIENVAGSIRVRGSSRSDVHVTGSVGEGAKGVLIEGDGRRLRIAIEYPKGGSWGGWWGGGSHGDSTLEVELPAGVELQVEAVSASVEVRGMTGRRVAIESVSGGIEFDGAPDELEIEAVSGAVDVRSGGIREVALETVSGRVAFEGAVGERLRAESVSGRLQLNPQGALQSVEASAVSGQVELSTALAAGGRLNAESLSGELSVTLPKATSARVNASSFSGTIRSDVGKVEKEGFGPGSSLKATLGDGNGEVRLESFSGTLRLRLQ